MPSWLLFSSIPHVSTWTFSYLSVNPYHTAPAAGTQSYSSGGLSSVSAAGAYQNEYNSNSSSSAEYLMADFGKNVKVNNIYCYKYSYLSEGEGLMGCDLEYSADGVSWVLLPNLENINSLQTRSGPYIARYVRMTNHGTNFLRCTKFYFD